MSKHVSVIVAALVGSALVGCGTKPKPMFDAGVEEDAGMEVDAGRVRGDDPPTGFQVAFALPMGAAASTHFVSVSSAPDQFNQPLIAAQYEDPNGDLNYDDNRVFFTRWDGTAKAFTAPLTIEVVGGAASQHPYRQVAVARDAVSGRIGVAYVKGQANTIRLATSDDEAANFSLTTVSDEQTVDAINNVALALQGGVAHVAYLEGSKAVYRTRTGNTGAWSEQRSPIDALPTSGLGLALDASNQPAVVFIAAAGATSGDLVFWRPGSTPVTVASADMNDLSAADKRPSAAVQFNGGSAYVAFHLSKLTAPDATQLWFAKSDDNGVTWGTPIAIPRNSDGTAFHSTQWYQALAVESATRIAIGAPWSSSGTQSVCNGPKLARSTDGATFTTCSPAGTPIQRGGDWISLWPYKPGKLSLVFSYDQRSNPSIKAGLLMWREP
ncbi:MAG: hypothetical protein U0228_28780 [Myxococcaceae bacterium]